MKAPMPTSLEELLEKLRNRVNRLNTDVEINTGDIKNNTKLIRDIKDRVNLIAVGVVITMVTMLILIARTL